MIFSCVAIVLVFAVSYFHYVQGFFSAALSAIIAILASMLAISYHEPLSMYMMGGKFTDTGTGLSLIGLFVAFYVILRIVFDKAVPGNLRLPVTAEKIGAGAMGLTAGIFSVGTFVIAAQAMPFGVSIAGYTRFLTVDRQDTQFTGGTHGSMQDSAIYDVMKNPHFETADASGLLFPIDDMVVGMVKHLSDGGSLAGPQSFSTVHPAYLTELFGQRTGVQTGAHHVAYNTEKEKQVELKGLFTIDTAGQGDAEMSTIANRFEKLADKVSSDPGKLLLVARLSFSHTASDSDNYIRVSTGGVRLVTNAKDFHPIGTLQQPDGTVVRVNRADDFLIVPSNGTVDFVFDVDRDDFGFQPDPKGGKEPDLTMPADAFIEAKRLAMVDLSGATVTRKFPGDPGPSVLRKKGMQPVAGAGATASATPTAAQQGGPLEIGRANVSAQFFTDVNVGSIPPSGGDVTFHSGTAQIKDGKFSKLSIDPTDSLAMLKQGPGLIQTLWAPPGTGVIQVEGFPGGGDNRWAWADKIGSLELADAEGKTFKCNGVATKGKAGIADKVVAKYDANQTIGSLDSNNDFKPVSMYFYFVVPSATTITEIRIDGKAVKKSLSLAVQ